MNKKYKDTKCLTKTTKMTLTVQLQLLKYLKFGPDLSSSHWMQSFREPSGLFNASPVAHDAMQTCNTTMFVRLKINITEKALLISNV
jgi:hypothetical protein